MAMSINERNEMVLSNLGLIKTITSKYDHSNNRDNFEDSYQNGVLRFLEIADKFDPERGCRLSTFIWPHIQNYIVEQNTSVPTALRRQIKKIEDVREYLESKTGAAVSDSDISKVSGVSEKNIGKYRSELNGYRTVSLNPVCSSDDGKELDLLNMEFENPEKTPEENMMEKENVKIIKAAWNNLDEEERTILSYRTTYSTNLKEPLSLRQVAEIMGSNRTTISEKEKKATAHLKRILMNQGLCA